jgi:tetratricopeptide (TPR) repeat protein
VTAYWLGGLGKQKEAEEFLREGLRNNPNSCEILFELGRLYGQNESDVSRARHVWELALRKWKEQEAAKPEPNLMLREQIAVNLGRLEEQSGNLPRAVELLEMVRANSPKPEALQKQIDELRARMASPVITPRPPAN